MDEFFTHSGHEILRRVYSCNFIPYAERKTLITNRLTSYGCTAACSSDLKEKAKDITTVATVGT